MHKNTEQRNASCAGLGKQHWGLDSAKCPFVSRVEIWGLRVHGVLHT